MRTRGKTKVETGDYSKDGMDPRDLLDDGENTNGYADDKIEDIAPSRNDSRNARNTGNRRPGRLPKVGTSKNRNEKLMESAEFREVVQGFFDFIEEINKSRGGKRPTKKTAKAKNGETRPDKPIDEPELRKKQKTEMLKPLSNDKPEIQSPSPSETAKLYKFKEDLPSKGLMELISNKDQNAHPSSYVQAGGQDSKGQFAEQARKEAQVNKPGFQGNMMDFGHFDPNSLKYGNLQELNNNLMFNKNKAVPSSNPYEYNTTMFKDIMQRMQMQGYGEQNPMRNYGMPFDYGGGYHKMGGLESFGVKPSAAEMMNLQMIEALLQKNQPNILGSLFGNSPALFGDLPREFPYNMVQNMGGHQRYGNQSLGVELIQSDPEAINPKVYEGKLGRASTHVAIAYFIHFKSLDPDTIAKSDKSKVDPTYNARMLKEKKYETYPGEQSLASKLLPQGLESRLAAGLGLGNNFPLEYLGAQDIQKLLSQQGLGDHHLREMHLQRLQQEQALRNEEIARRNLMNKNNEIKLEEERAEQQRRQNERANRPPNKPSVIKEDEIIEIKENSDAEVEEVKEEIPQEKVEVKDEVKSENERKPSNPNQMQIEGEAGPISAEDIVEEITELTSSSNYDPKKGGKRSKTTLNKPVKKPSEEAGRPEPKANAMVEEIESTAHHANNGADKEGEAKQGIQVISDDEEGTKMQIEPAPEKQIEEEPAANPPQ